MHKNDFRVMYVLDAMDANHPMRAVTIKQLCEQMEKETDAEQSYRTLHSVLTGLCVAEYVSKGLKESRAETYYITSRGIEKLKELGGA